MNKKYSARIRLVGLVTDFVHCGVSTPTQIAIALWLSIRHDRYEGGASNGEIAAAVGVEGSPASKAISVLVKIGLLARTRSTEDGRKVAVKPTERLLSIVEDRAFR